MAIIQERITAREFPLESQKVSDVKIITCILREELVDDVLKEICDQYGVGGITLTPVQGYDPRSGEKAQFRGVVYPLTRYDRIRLEVCVPSDQVNQVVNVIRSVARTGKTGDGKIFITDVCGVVRIRTGEIGLSAL